MIVPLVLIFGCESEEVYSIGDTAIVAIPCPIRI